MNAAKESLSEARQRKHVLFTASPNGFTTTNGGGRHDRDHDGVLLPQPQIDSSSNSLTSAQSSITALTSQDLLLANWKSADFSTRRGPNEQSYSYVPMLLSYDEVPEWHRDNEYIRHGYRPESRSIRACYASWLYLHNETVNIFSHLIPSIFFLAAEFWIFTYFRVGFPQAKPLERFVFAFFLLTAFFCLGISATYHTLTSHSANVSHLWLRFDFIGIVILTLGDFVSGIYMVFYCEPTLQKVYWTMILTLGAATIFILLHPRFQGKKYRTFRVATFVCTGMSGFAPLAHGCAIFGFSAMMKQSGMPYYIAEGLLLVLGALFYTTRMPETLKPGRFDIFGASHQIFHILVVMATVVQLVGIMNAYNYNYHHRTCGPAYTVLAGK